MKIQLRMITGAGLAGPAHTWLNVGQIWGCPRPHISFHNLENVQYNEKHEGGVKTLQADTETPFPLFLSLNHQPFLIDLLSNVLLLAESNSL